MGRDFDKIVAVVDCTLVVVVVVEDSHLKEGDYFLKEHSIDIYLAEADRDFDSQDCLK